MKRKLLTLIASVAVTAALAQTSVPAFPGAEGHGRYTTGGRGGTVIHVTNLNDSGTGSLRAAVSGSAKKTIVFDVGGVIALNSDLNIGANTTIMGQTAPAPGITLRYYTVRPGANNIIRFIRIRRGQEKDVNDGADATWQRNVTNMILDHCSFSWSIDEVASFYDNNNFTMQWCTIGESLNNAGHDKGAHGYGGIWGGKLASFHHNMIAHVNNRAPRFCGARYLWNGYSSNELYSTYNWENPVQAENVDFRNCVMFNWGSGSCYGGPGGGQINIVNNYYKGGPATSQPNRVTTVTVAASDNSGDNSEIYKMTSRYYISGNTTENASGTKIQNRDWGGVTYDSGTFTINGERYSYDNSNYYGDDVEHVANSNGDMCVKIKMDEPAPTGEVTTHTAANAFTKVLAYAGASLNRDDVDARYMQEAETGNVTYTGSVTGKKGMIDLVSDVNGYTEDNFGTGERAADFDTDGDGIPDAWETANGLNPNSAADGNTYTLDRKGYYTNLEVYCNSLVQDIMIGGNEDATTLAAAYYPAYYKEDGTYVEAVNIDPNGGTTDPGEQEEIASGTISYTFDGGELCEATVASNISSYISATSMSVGSNFTLGTTTVNGIAMTSLLATAKESSAAASNLVNFTVAPESGYYFTPTNVAFNISRIGTDSGIFDLTWSNSSETIYLANGYEYLRNNEANGWMTSYSKDVTAATASEGESSLNLYIYNLNANKSSGLANIVITGTISKLSDASGIKNVTGSTNGNGDIYNLQGQKVDSSFKGIVIKNGKKYLNR